MHALEPLLPAIFATAPSLHLAHSDVVHDGSRCPIKLCWRYHCGDNECSHSRFDTNIALLLLLERISVDMPLRCAGGAVRARRSREGRAWKCPWPSTGDQVARTGYPCPSRTVLHHVVLVRSCILAAASAACAQAYPRLGPITRIAESGGCDRFSPIMFALLSPFPVVNCGADGLRRSYHSHSCFAPPRRSRTSTRPKVAQPRRSPPTQSSTGSTRAPSCCRSD